eukprot:jgi/Chrzof1/5883/Cz16g19090.t1_FBP3A[v5.2]
MVNFKDLNLSVDDEFESDYDNEDFQAVDEDPTNKQAIINKPRSQARGGAVKNKLIIIMVGLPGRGKTFLCNKLKCYLNWLGHNTAHINVGNYRRLQRGKQEVQDAAFFDCHNKAGLEARHRALAAALDDLMAYLASDSGQVAIFDATNTTNERRQQLINTFHGKYQYMFIESICTDSQVLEQNYRYKMKFSPDYQGVDTEAALADFKERINKYNEVYEPINNRNLHYIKLIDMVTGRGYMDVNRISGYIPGKIVFFLMQVCKAGMTVGQSRKIWLTRHGESEWNMLGKIGGDSAISARGEEYARLVPDVLEQRLPATFNEDGVPVSVWTSTLRRTIMTANYLPYPKLRWKALDEIHAGICDGMTYAEIATQFPDDFEARKRDKLRYRYPSGESYLDVIQRLEPVIIEMERERECVCVVAHQAVLRAVYGYFTATPLKDIPRLDIPLHTLIELQPRPDGTMEVTRIPVSVATHRCATTPYIPQPSHFCSHSPPVQLPLGSCPNQSFLSPPSEGEKRGRHTRSLSGGALGSVTNFSLFTGVPGSNSVPNPGGEGLRAKSYAGHPTEDILRQDSG